MKAKCSAGFDADVDRLVRTSTHLAARGIVASTKGYLQHAKIFYSYVDLAAHPVKPIDEAARTGRTNVGGLKLFIDGSVSNRTAWMRGPYRDSSDQRGMRTAGDDDLAGALKFARENKLQIACHAMGDRAVEHVVEFYEDEEPWMGHYPSVRIEHASVLSDELIDRIKAGRKDFGLVTNIDFFFAEYDSYSQNLTDEQFSRAYPVRDLYERFEKSALSSDCPATTWNDPDNPFMSIQAAVTRRAYNGESIVPEQKVSVAQALLMYTGRARLVSDFGGVGAIAEGREASFITLSDDVFEIDPGRIIDTKVTGTWIAGEKVYAL